MKTTLHNTNTIKVTARLYAHFWTISLQVATEGSRDSEVDFFFDKEEAFNEAKKAFYNIQTEDCRS
tara:strand:- start:1652 stop:1849 length:198 start_codon:yes stop_codon:yes gene_type:complete